MHPIGPALRRLDTAMADSSAAADWSERSRDLARLLGLRRRIIGLNDTLSFLQAATLEFFPGKPFSLDNYRSLQVDGVCSQSFPLIFGITPAALEDVVPTYFTRGA